MAKIFFSYSHDDEAYRDQLEKHLAFLKNQGAIEPWHDRRLLAGEPLDASINQAIDTADVILLLISSSFMASRYCFSVEMARAMERHKRGEARVIPVIVRPCVWQVVPLKDLVAVPTDGKPITSHANYDDAYADVARHIQAVVEVTPSMGSASKASPQQVTAVERGPSGNTHPRSSNLRVRKSFTELERDRFLHETFEFVVRFFEGSLSELQTRNASIEGRLQRISSQSFAATIYENGTKLSECSVHIGAGGFRQGGITYSSDASSRGNSFNEMLTVEADDQKLFLKPMGMSMRGPRDQTLSQEGAAEFLWEILMRPVQ